MSIRMIIVLMITLYSSRVILRVLGVEDYGIYNVVCGFVSMFTFLNTALTTGTQRFYNYELGKKTTNGLVHVYNTAFIIQILLVFIIVIPAEIIGMWYVNNKMVITADRIFAARLIFQFALISFIAEIMQVPYSAAVVAHERMDFYAFISILKALLNLSAIIIVSFIQYDGLIAYGLLLCGSSILILVLYIVYCKYHFQEMTLKKEFDLLLFKRMLSFSGWNCFGTFGSIMKEQGINLVLNLFFGPVVNAARGIAFQVRSGIMSFISNLTVPVGPQVIQSYSSGNIQRSLNLTYSISKFSCYFLFIAALPLILEIDYVLRLWLGSNIPYHTNKFVVLVLLTIFGTNLNSAISKVVHASGKMRDYQLFSSLVKVLSVPVSYFLFLRFPIPELAMIMVFIFDLLSHFIGLVIFRTIVQDFSILNYVNRVIFPVLSVVLIGSIFPYLCHYYFVDGIYRLLIVSLMSVIWGSVCVYIIGLTRTERGFVKQILNNFLSLNKR